MVVTDVMWRPTHRYGDQLITDMSRMLQAFEYQCWRVIRDDETPGVARNLLIDGFENTMSYLPTVDHWRVSCEWGMQRNLETDELIGKIYARGWIRQRSDGTEWVLP